MGRFIFIMGHLPIDHGAFPRPSWSPLSFDRLILRIVRRTPVREPPALQSVSLLHSSPRAACTPVPEPLTLHSASRLHSSPRTAHTPVRKPPPNWRGFSHPHGGKGLPLTLNFQELCVSAPTKNPKYDKIRFFQTKEDYHASSDGKRKKNEYR